MSRRKNCKYIATIKDMDGGVVHYTTTRRTKMRKMVSMCLMWLRVADAHVRYSYTTKKGAIGVEWLFVLIDTPDVFINDLKVPMPKDYPLGASPYASK